MFGQCYDAVYYSSGRDWNGTVGHHSNNNSCFGSIFIKVMAFSLFLDGHTHNKTLSYRTIEGRKDLAIILLKSTTQVVFIYFTYH